MIPEDNLSEDEIDISKILDEIAATNAGESLDTYREQQALRNRIRIKSKKFLKTPVNSWPNINIHWDISKESQNFCLDGVKHEEFLKAYPSGFFLGYVDLVEFDQILDHYSRRDDGELWTLGSANKLSYLIVYLSEGRPISPPLVRLTEDSNRVVFGGGHHRYAIAKAIGEERIPICVDPKYKSQFDILIKVSWVDLNLA